MHVISYQLQYTLYHFYICIIVDTDGHAAGVYSMVAWRVVVGLLAFCPIILPTVVLLSATESFTTSYLIGTALCPAAVSGIAWPAFLSRLTNM